ncbi:MAG: hypothetical protein M5U09_19000 [Gammaproteobacteria bacterium]|nr:hypothetical protein [Gammaproteobacteria bacterium]
MIQAIEIDGASGPGRIVRIQSLPEGYTIRDGRVTRTVQHGDEQVELLIFPGRWYPAPEGAHEGDTYDPATGEVTSPPAPPLEEIRPAALRMIDDVAGEARARFITVAPGQESVYQLKLEHARAYAAADYTGDVPAMVAAEAAAQDITEQAATDFILATAEQWIAVAAQIEQLRQAGKTAIRAAGTATEIDTIVSDTLDGLNAIRPD